MIFIINVDHYKGKREDFLHFIFPVIIDCFVVNIIVVTFCEAKLESKLFVVIPIREKEMVNINEVKHIIETKLFFFKRQNIKNNTRFSFF